MPRVLQVDSSVGTSLVEGGLLLYRVVLLVAAVYSQLRLVHIEVFDTEAIAVQRCQVLRYNLTLTVTHLHYSTLCKS